MNLVKESLAKLLAQEDLIVEHRKVDTAQFNVETRVLTLPMWKHDSNLVIDMLIAHEVGHALYTPNRWDFVKEVPLSFVNVTEDVRIEKLMKRRYEGLPKTFFGGYNVLAEEDFFQVEDVNWDVLNIADKVNLHYKIGNFIDVPFNSDEAVFRDDALHLETFEDAIELAKRMHAYAQAQVEEKKQQQEEEVPAMEVPFEGSPDLGEDNTEYPLEDLSTGKTPQEPTEEGEGVEAEKAEPESVGGKEAGRGNGPSGAQYSADEVQTADTLAEAIEDLAQTNTSVTEYSYIELPEKVSSKTFVSNQEVSDYIEQYYASKENLSVDPDEFVDEYDYRMAQYTTQVLREADKEYNQYKKEAQKEVSYLVKEFEMKKAADGYARQTISRTGVLNTGLLHTYKYNDDIFRKITTIPDAKSHGLIFNIDWSGSMSNALAATIKQVLSLVSFCRKVGIAYDVYSFTDAYETSDRYAYKEDPKFKHKVICRNFNMVNLLTSKSNNRTHAKQAKNLYRIAASFANRSGGVPHKMGLGGTPLDESMIAMNEIIPAFKKKTGAQKVHVVNLTDGEGYGISYGQTITTGYNSDEQHVVARRIGSRTRLRDRQTGQTYQFDDDNYGHTKTFVTLLRNRFPECSFMNIRLCNGGDWSRFKRECLGYDNPEGYAKADAQWKKTKSFICTSSAYTVQYALSIGALSNDAEFEVVEDATKAQIRSAFKKSLNAKKMNKKILSSFIEQIA